ncbi:monofunctional biosynthetic peptidoglycan transglycosylase [Ilyomonas limi]|uniref:Biosynthetic peptidoglycan transglycosylase n=1 Tax=Ilyomonas limi TaxID=2575867 RepID=A0A4U3KXZ2_9BACT|nr:monofunctional biosynthetic peptidoglycan transglycosylase [Ilyomonas limi]TKK66594.1 monofunctional biosynthetic peptidoglycan transglycosylase [Ilyomonas limi]
MATSAGAFIWRWIKRIFLFCFISSFLYIIICKWIMPPVTITQLSSLIEGDGLKRDYVSKEDISPNLRLAAMASEDQLFPNHNGFDWKALEKSLNSNPKKKGRIRGGAASTISQQVAKNVFLWQGEGFMRYVRKVPEFYFTKMIEWIWGKQRILEVYLNVIEMGKGIYGAEAAAEAYFGKHAESLTRKEAAMIIACLPNPKIYTVKPISRFVSWKSNWILRQMNNIEDDEDIKSLTY